MCREHDLSVRPGILEMTGDGAGDRTHNDIAVENVMPGRSRDGQQFVADGSFDLVPSSAGGPIPALRLGRVHRLFG